MNIETTLRNWVNAAPQGQRRAAKFAIGIEEDGQCSVHLEYAGVVPADGCRLLASGFHQDSAEAFRLAEKRLASMGERRKGSGS